MTENSWFRDYCEKTTSHCMQYFVMKDRSPVEKLFWILTFLCMISITCGALRVLIDVWIDSPTIIFIENTESAIQDIPFPSINICPSSQLRKWVWEKHMNTNTSYWENLQHYRYGLCSLDFYNYIGDKKASRNYFDKDVIMRLINDCAISCSEVFQLDAKWENLTVSNFCQFVQPKLSLLGLCFSVNMMPSFQMLNNEYNQRYLNFFLKNNSYIVTEKSNWNLDDGYPPNSENDLLVNINPARTSGVSHYHRLRLTINILDQEFFSCSSQSHFFITLSHPAEYFLTDPRSFIKPDTYTKIQITPFVKKIDSQLKWRSLEARKCYLHNERKLSIFQQYTQVNCNMECVLNETLTICGCVSFDMVYLVAPSVQICGVSKRECLIKAQKATYEPEMQLICKCWPTCSVVEYKIAYTSHYDDWAYMKLTNIVKNNSRGATVEFVFNKPYFTAYTSTSIVDLDSLISNIGGLISLCLGLNLINLFEILYIMIKMIVNYIIHMFDNT
ncbi:pickpocket protein 28-like [Myzus persicae]|uniref:pickpocket protein 28-like n=1 Tax=Myzus persicae TaxID=13164 RepID=UPI000B92FBA8|nr:pickpocket protein 28-like [Myzus persicae]